MTTKRTDKQKNGRENEKSNDKSVDVHCRFKPGTAEWLQKKRNRDAPTVPRVVSDIVEEKRRAEGG